MELSYDHAFSAPGGGTNFNGNISAASWRSKNDNERRAYAYTYDGSNRLIKAQFTQYTAGWNTTAGKDYTAMMGDGVTPVSAYDANGNIQKMTHFTAPSTKIDELVYNYNYVADGNKLWRVTDNFNSPASILGDFKEITSGQNQDYSYDANGNLAVDNNKGISSITYNHLNLPTLITITGKGTIGYTYDALGNKLKKTVTDNTISKTTTTMYIDGFQYTRDTLFQFAHEDGRVRRKPDGSYIFDYFEKDHLGSVRVTLTEESTVIPYLVAGMEPQNASAEDTYYYNIEETRTKKPMAYPATDSSNRFAAKLDGEQRKTGPAIILKVMAGDTLNIRANSWYQYNERKPDDRKVPLEELALSMANNLLPQAAKLATDVVNTANPLSAAIFSLLQARQPDDPAVNRKPKAYLNWILLDEDLNPIPEDTTINPLNRKEYKGYQQVGNAGEITQHVKKDWTIEKSGFVYIFTSNESPDADVYFDDLGIMSLSGSLLEVSHYYPFGLKIAGISSNAVGMLENRIKYNGIEFTSDLGLDIYDAQFRNLDPQIGRWRQIDPKPNDAISPYAAMDNNPIRYSDFLGDTTIAGAGFWRNAWEGLKDGGRATASWVKSLGTTEGIGNTLDGMAAMSPFNVDEGAVGARAQMIGNAVNYVGNIPNKTSDQIGHDVGFGVEKIGEVVLASKGSSIVSNALRATAFVDMAAEAEIVTPLVNSRGVPYPRISVNGYGEVPFPEGPFVPNNSSTLRSSFTTGYKMEFRNWWTEQGRPWPTAPEGSSINIHHIKPLKFGGTNNFENLVPLVQPLEHQPFTNWWRNFNH
ncbi:RHS repeat-associated core domain-containing protein [Chitinophaga sp.]|uniref:RHS repeat-associated core domain-containing protein n=1 Tax=Chitinophaga sp. TaxID=1869181 RepID=UPI002F92AD1C